MFRFILILWVCGVNAYSSDSDEVKTGEDTGRGFFLVDKLGAEDAFITYNAKVHAVKIMHPTPFGVDLFMAYSNDSDSKELHFMGRWDKRAFADYMDVVGDAIGDCKNSEFAGFLPVKAPAVKIDALNLLSLGFSSVTVSPKGFLTDYSKITLYIRYDGSPEVVPIVDVAEKMTKDELRHLEKTYAENTSETLVYALDAAYEIEGRVEHYQKALEEYTASRD